jgi:osmotically-inducible protein OsmY
MAIRDFVRNVGEKVLPDKGSKSSSSSSGSSSGGRQQQQYLGAAPGQQGSGQASGRAPQTGQDGQAGQNAQSAQAERSQDAILQHIKDNVADAPEDLTVVFDTDDGIVILTGTAPSDEVAELVIIAAGNIEGVGQVDDRMTRGQSGSRSSSGSPRSGGSSTKSR